LAATEAEKGATGLAAPFPEQIRFVPMRFLATASESEPPVVGS
jgi:hypothetical protein